MLVVEKQEVGGAVRKKVAVVLLLLAGAVAGFGMIAAGAGLAGASASAGFAACGGSGSSAFVSPAGADGAGVFAASESGAVAAPPAPGFSWAVIGEAVGVSLEAAVVEEVVFRGVLLWALVALFEKRGRCAAARCPRAAAQGRPGRPGRPVQAAVLASALVFGVLHLLPDGPLVTDGAWRAALAWCASAPDPEALAVVALAAQGALKVAQATAFGYLMGLLVVRSRWFAEAGCRRALSLAMPLVLHFAFDLLCLGMPLVWGVSLPDSYLTGCLPDIAALTVSCALLLAAVRLAEKP